MSRFVLLLALGLALASCREPIGCDLCTTSVTVRGTVRTAAGAPAPGVTVTLEPFSDSCGGRPLLVFDRRTGNPPIQLQTDAEGRYQVVLFAPTSPGPRCTRVTVTPPAALGTAQQLERTIPFAADSPRASTAVAVIDVQLAPPAEPAR
jgi:hypothetical protein